MAVSAKCNGDIMIEYRVYQLDRDGRIEGPAEILHAEDDDAALIKAQRYLKDRALEIWADDRRVAFIPADE